MNKLALFILMQISAFLALLLPLLNPWLVFIPLAIQLTSWIIPMNEIKRLNAEHDKSEEVKE